MPIPFDQIGPGQIARTVVQVIGKDGPIFNPRNISYLSPNEVTSQVFEIPGGPSVGLEGLALAGTIASVGLSALTLRECRKISGEIKSVRESQDRIEKTLSEISRRVERIDCKVAEGHLREALRHAAGKAFHSDSIDLSALAQLIEDLESFSETVGDDLIFNFQLRLTSDMRDHLGGLLSLLQNTRRSIAAFHNCAVAGDPDRVVTFRLASDYLPAPSYALIDVALAIGRDDAVFHSFAAELGKAISDRFFFAGDQDSNDFTQYCYNQYYEPQYAALRSLSVTRAATTLSMILDDLKVDYEDESSASSQASEIVLAWSTSSDSFLIHALIYELEAVKSGYETVFYGHLASASNCIVKPMLLSMANTAAVSS